MKFQKIKNTIKKDLIIIIHLKNFKKPKRQNSIKKPIPLKSMKTDWGCELVILNPSRHNFIRNFNPGIESTISNLIQLESLFDSGITIGDNIARRTDSKTASPCIHIIPAEYRFQKTISKRSLLN